MSWDMPETELRDQFNSIPGGIDLAKALVSQINPGPDSRALEITPGGAVIATMLAKDTNSNITFVAKNATIEAEAESLASSSGVSDKIRIIPASPLNLPLPAEEFNFVYGIGWPFNPHVTPELAREIYRVLVPDGVLTMAGPVSINNSFPDYMKDAIDDYPGVKPATPAYSALLFAREGFHIVTAEFFGGAWDYWNEWLEIAPPELVTDNLRNAIAEDGGRWLSLGIITLRKPPRPAWAV